jgi:hypothetical protein
MNIEDVALVLSDHGLDDEKIQAICCDLLRRSGGPVTGQTKVLRLRLPAGGLQDLSSLRGVVGQLVAGGIASPALLEAGKEDDGV